MGRDPLEDVSQDDRYQKEAYWALPKIARRHGGAFLCDGVGFSNDDVTTVVCAPVYREVLGLRTKVTVGPGEGLPRQSAIRCDFLMLMFKSKLTGFVATLPPEKRNELRRALLHALQLES